MPAEPGVRTPEIDEQLLRTALRLFAALGYDGTSVGMIAEAAGRDPAEIAAVGGKPALYRAAMESYSKTAQGLVGEFTARTVHDAADAHEFLDRMLDFHFEHPEFNSLWVQRWLSDALDLPDVEQTYRMPIMDFGRRLLSAATEAEQEDVEMAVSLFDWAIHGFFAEGVQRPGATPLRSDDPRARRRFRGYMHYLLDLLIRDHQA